MGIDAGRWPPGITITIEQLLADRAEIQHFETGRGIFPQSLKIVDFFLYSPPQCLSMNRKL